MVDHSLRPLRPDDVEAAEITLGRAFETDPMFEWLFPDENTRPDLCRRIMSAPIQFGLRYGHVTTSEDASGVAIWAPAESPVTTLRMARSGFLAMPFSIGLRNFLQFAAATSVMDRIHTAQMPDPHWYLFVLGVAPEKQGLGLGSALINEGLERADRSESACFLETSSKGNVKYYGRFGFKVVGEATLGKGGPPGWGMRREAAG